MVKLLLGLDTIPKPHDATDALAVAICHLHNGRAIAEGRLRQAQRPRKRRPQACQVAGGDYRPREMIARLRGKVAREASESRDR